GALLPLMMGASHSLTVASAENVSRWIALKILVSEHMTLPGQPADPVYEQAVKRQFMIHGEMPPWLRIWIAKCTGDKWQTSFLRHCSMVTADQTKAVSGYRKNAQFITFGIGNLLVHAVGVTDADVFPRFELDAEPAGTLWQIWPLPNGNILWPPGFELSDPD